MVRFSVSLDEEQNEWVEQRADELSGSKSQVVSMVIDAARRNDVQLGTHLERSDSESPESIEDRFEKLEARLDELEAAIKTESEATSASQEPATQNSEPNEASTPHNEASRASSQDPESASSKGQLNELRDDPEVNAVRTFIEREGSDKASADAITECWEFLKQRGTASPKAFKNRFAPESCTTEDDVERWWQDGVKPVFQQLPGVEAPDDGGRFYRYKY
jgi:hypothetical protein